MFGYSTGTWLVLLAMIGTGTARTIMIKLLYQTGFEAPLYVTLLYLTSQVLFLGVYAVQRCRDVGDEEETDQEEDQEEASDMETGKVAKPQFGSRHGLKPGAKEGFAVRWSRKIPYLLKPAIPGFFNMLNALLRLASFVYVAASVGEMLTSGMDLALSTLAARVIRHRMVSCRRWMGVGVVMVGLTIIGAADVLMESDSTQTGTSSRDSVIGILLIVGQTVVGVLQDMAEEIVMQESEFPAALMLGMQGAFGIGFALILFFFVPMFGITATDTIQSLQENAAFLVPYSIGLTLIFMVAGFFGVKSIQVTSAMTRNVWKTTRAILVWLVLLLVYYVGNDSRLGEPFVVPESLVIMAGFAVMVTGIFVYYSQKATEETARETEEEMNDNSGFTDQCTTGVFDVEAGDDLEYVIGASMFGSGRASTLGSGRDFGA